jgi:hypothetical protein
MRTLHAKPIDHLRIRVHPPRAVRTAVVCLPVAASTADMRHRAETVLTRMGLRSAGVLPHFPVDVRYRPWRVRSLVDWWHGLTSGGPVALLDLARMRAHAAQAADLQWRLWNEAVRGTKPAWPFWHYVDRCRNDPARYPLGRAQVEYRSQPRILAMGVHNAVYGGRGPVPALPTWAVEAFQAGHHTYVTLAALAAVPGDGLATGPATGSVVGAGGWLTAASDRLVDVLAFLTAANRHLDALPTTAALVAVASPVAAGDDR